LTLPKEAHLPSFDWMTDPRFRTEIEEEVSRTAGRTGMQRYQPAMADTLVSYMAARRPQRLQEELRKSVAEQRTKADALQSVQVLVAEASQRAAANRRDTVTVTDLEEAYQAKFCQVWPFC
jgi:hypothetical protein